MNTKLYQYLLEECLAMVKYLSDSGKKIPTEALPLIEDNTDNSSKQEISNTDIITLHGVLSKKIAPARPETIWLLYKESHKSKWLKFLGPVGLVRRMMFTAIISLLCFIAISLSPEINFENIKCGIYELDDMKLLIVLFFLLTSASLGASFSNLFQANQYIMKNIFNPRYESSYWIRYVLGIIAGIMLADIIPVPDVDSANKDAVHLAVASRPMLAMLGGFSASLVYRIMFRLVYAVEAIFVGKKSDEVEQKLANLQASNDIDIATNNQQFVGKLIKLQSQISSGKTTKDINDEIQNIITEMT